MSVIKRTAFRLLYDMILDFDKFESKNIFYDCYISYDFTLYFKMLLAPKFKVAAQSELHRAVRRTPVLNV